MPIFNKSILSAAVTVAKTEKDDKELSCVYIEPTGEVIAANQWAIFVASPTVQGIINKLPFNDQGTLNSAQAFPFEQIADLVRSIPPDKQFKGILEHCVISKTEINKSSAIFHDGRGTRPLTLRSVPSHPALVSWKKRITELGKDKGSYFVYNRRRLKVMVEAVETACSYSGEFAFIEQRAFDRGMLWRAFNELTHQIVLIAWVTPSAEKAPVIMDWEKSLSVPKVKTVLQRRR